MTTQPKSRFKRLRPRFSVKTMLVVTLLIAVYFALGTPTKRWGVKDVVAYHNSDISTGIFAAGIGDADLVAPLLIRVESRDLEFTDWSAEIVFEERDQYYVWFFGFVVHAADGPTENHVIR